MTDSLPVFYVFILAAIIENLVFARVFGVDGVIEQTKTYSEMARFGLLIVPVTVLGGAAAWYCKFLFSQVATWRSIRLIVIPACVSAASLLVWGIAQVVRKKRFDAAKEMVVVASFTAAALGAVVLALSMELGILNTLIYCAGSAVGLTLAMMLIHSGRERMEVSEVPRAFKGIPITLIYIGMLSLAIYGLTGHALPN